MNKFISFNRNISDISENNEKIQPKIPKDNQSKYKAIDKLINIITKIINLFICSFKCTFKESDK